MVIVEEKRTEVEVDEFYRSLERRSLGPLWKFVTQTREPATSVLPFHWKWSDIYPALLDAAEVMRLEGIHDDDGPVERRALHLLNPGVKDLRAITNTLVVSTQLILPGEVAPAHRHAPHAIRFMIQGSGAYSTVNGEKATMELGDLILTPGGTWHDHGNVSDEPIVWMDGLDRLLIQKLDAGGFDPHPTGQQELSKPIDYSVRKFGPTSLRPAWEAIPTGPIQSPQIRYKWKETETALRNLAGLGERSPYDEVAMAYVNPETGGHALSTMGLIAQILTPGARTKAHRNTGSAVYHVASGRGTSVINGLKISWQKGDFFVVPPWAWFEHANSEGSDDAFLFCLNDHPVFHSLGLFREQAFEDHGGEEHGGENQGAYQRVTGDLNGG